VFVTPDGVAAAQVTPSASGKPRLDRCVYEKEGSNDPFGRVLGRLPNRRSPTVSVLDPAGYRLLLVEAPDVPADELRAAVRWRVKDLIDFHVDDAVIDVFEMPPHARGGPQRMMYAVTAKAEAVKREIDRIEGAGLKLDVVDIPELSLRNVATLLESEQRGAALLYLGERRSTLLLVRQGVLYLARHIETGVATLADAGELRPELVAGLALEVRRSLDYFESHYEQTSIQQLHASGLEPADREAIGRELGLGVREVDLSTVLETDEALSAELQRLCMPAIGAALRKDPVAL
jgi:MSHA biogenesis protein MshI